MKIAAYEHWWPNKAAQTLMAKAKPDRDPQRLTHLKNRERRGAVNDLDIRFRFMNRYPDVVHVLTISQPPVEDFVGPEDALEISKMANDELSELVVNYPDRFIAGVAILPLNDMDLALKECDRAITELGLKGIRLYTTHLGETLDSPRLWPLYEKMAGYDLPIWIHHTIPQPLVGPKPYFPGDTFTNGGGEYEATKAMLALADSSVFEDFPNIKFIIHHMGVMIPFYAARFTRRKPRRCLNLHKFYVDTALYGNTPGLMCGYAFFGADHILFGADMPLGGSPAGFMDETLRAVDMMDIPQADKDKIYLENAIKLLGLSV